VKDLLIECSVEQDSDKQQQWVFRTSAQKWDKKMIEFYNKDKNKSVMIWACFKDDNQKSDLVFMSDDSEAKQKRIISAVYLKILEE